MTPRIAEEYDLDRLGYHDLQRIAMAYVLEDEHWPAFLDWILEQEQSDAVRQWLARKVPDLAELRRDWCRHSEVPAIRTLGIDLRGEASE